MEGNLRFKIDWASLMVRRNLLFLLCFTLYLRAISKYNPLGGLYLEGRFNKGFFASRVWGAYTWRGLFSEFYDTGHVASVFVLLCLAEGGHFAADDCFTQKSRSPSTRSAAHLHISLHISHETA